MRAVSDFMEPGGPDRVPMCQSGPAVDLRGVDRRTYSFYTDITMATAKQNMAIRVAPELIEELDKIGKAVNRSRAWLGEDALRHYVEIQRWHLQEITAGIKDIKAGRVIPNSEMEKWLNSWGRPDEKEPPFA